MCAQLRIVNVFKNYSQPFDAKDIILCVSHADPIRLAVAFFVRTPTGHVSAAGCLSRIDLHPYDQRAGEQAVEFECRPFFFLAREVILVYSFYPNIQQWSVYE